MRNTVDLIENELINFLFVGLVWIHSDERRSLSSFVAKRELAVDQVNPSYSYDGFAAISHSENRTSPRGKKPDYAIFIQEPLCTSTLRTK